MTLPNSRGAGNGVFLVHGEGKIRNRFEGHVELFLLPFVFIYLSHFAESFASIPSNAKSKPP